MHSSNSSRLRKSLAIPLLAIASLAVIAQEADLPEQKLVGLKSIWDGATFFSTTLENGLQVSIFADQRMPIVTTRVTYHVGSAHEDQDSRGLAHLFEHLMFAKTTNYPERAIFNYVEQFGGSTNAFTSFDETTYYALTPPQKHYQVLEIYADGMTNLDLSQEALDREKKVVLEELRVGAQNDPFNRLTMDILAKAMNEHPYSISPLGTEQDVGNATLPKCLAFYEKYYGPKNAHLLVVGPVDVNETFEFIQSTFGKISKEVQRSHAIPRLGEWTFPPVVNVQESIPPVDIAGQVYLLPTSESEDTYAVAIMISLLNGIDGYENKIVRKKRVALYAETAEMSFKAGRIFGFASVALPYRKQKAAFRFIDETIAELAEFEWLTEETLESKKKAFLRSEYLSRYYSVYIASRIQAAQDWQHDVEAAFDLEEKIEQVSVQDVKEAFTKYILQAQHVRIYVEPTHVPWYIRAFGRLYPLAERTGLADLFL